jgi:Fic family protein
MGHDEEEIAGYRDALQEIHSGYNSMDLSIELILGLHRTLMGYTLSEGGLFKTSDNVIMGIDEDGRRCVHFKPVSAKDTSDAMDQAILAYIDAMQEGVEPMLLIPCFILDFLSIHPFADGNGRMSRLLTLLLLYRSGHDVGRYISFEERIDSTRSRYYESLSLSSKNWHEGSNDYLPFIEYYLNILYVCYRGLDRCFMTVEDKKATKSNRIEKVVLDSIVPISKKEIMSMLPDVSQTTVESCLHRMLVDGKIKKIGGNRNARYRRA